MTGRTFELTHTFRFEAAHHLPNVPADHKCRRLHGHSFTCDVVVRGDLDEQMGWLVDYGDIKAAVAPLRSQLDHYYLHEVEGLENPTSENIAAWIWDRLLPAMPLLYSVTVRETCNNACTYFGPR